MEPTSERPPTPTSARRILPLLLGVVTIAVALAVAFVATRDDGDQVTAGGTTTTVDSPTPTTESPSTTGPTTTSSPLEQQEAATVVWPEPGQGSFDDPVGAATSFAVDLARFTEPVVGPFRAGDSRSGEVEIRSERDGPATTVLVRRLGDDNWYVIGATTTDIELDTPRAGTSISDPVRLTGKALAFEGTVQVSVFVRGDADPIGEGFVTGSGGGEPGPFADDIDFENPGDGAGVILLYVTSAKDGRVWQALAIPVAFAG